MAWVPQGWRPLVAQDDEGRSFRGSAVSPFGANMGLVLYRRKAEGARTGCAERLVLLLLLPFVGLVLCPSFAQKWAGYCTGVSCVQNV
eukprot:scaffold127261_cov21-Tisochrysis_lutea.AAC.1